MSESIPAVPVRFVRWLTVLLVAGLVGVGGELALTGHYEDRDQALPLASIVLSLVSLAWNARSSGSWARRVLGTSWVLLTIVGVVGIVLHYRSNYEFQVELNPELGMGGLVLASFQATSPPSLAPGVLILFGALGFLILRARTTTSSDRR